MGNDRLDKLFDGVTGTTPVTAADLGEVVGIVQELLRNHDLRKVPGSRHVTESATPGGETFGTFGAFTVKAIKYFQKKYNLPQKPEVDAATFRKLILTRAPKPSLGRAYLAKKLEINDSVLVRVAILIGAWEENLREGGFRNWKPQDSKDAKKTGLSYGIIQWTHGSKRLGDILSRFDTAPVAFESCFGVSGADKATMIAKAQAGKSILNDDGDPASAADASWNFQKAALWKAKFISAGEALVFQIKQTEQALADLKAVYTTKHSAWAKVTSKRGWGFMLDLSNQRGTDNANTRYNQAVAALPAGTESDLLDHILAAENSAFPGYKLRRDFFRLNTPLPEDQDFPAP